MTSYHFKESEEAMLSFWDEHRIYEKAKEKNNGNQPFYFLDGPPYTSGKVHLGTAWNKALKDMVLRYKRMRGFDVWDRAGYDMHGLPTENATMKKLGLRTNDDIQRYGVANFIAECKKLCLENMKVMNQAFKRLAVWMDFEHAYQSITKQFIEAEWWLIKQAHEKGRLYEGLRTMTWCPRSESALAKHELEYKTVTDDSIFVKFPLVEKKGKQPEREYLVIWTTTPWTIPFNLAVMVNPDVEYVKVKVTWRGKEEYWYFANALVGVFFGNVVDATYEIVETVQGAAMEGWRYQHPFADELRAEYEAIRKSAPKLHTVILSSEYVDTSGGSGLVHCAPGCGPEDYEVGHANGLPPFNLIDTKGVFPERAGKFCGLVAKQDDKKFIQALDEAGALIATTQVEHEYPHDWRYHQPVIFRTTKQWFFKVEDLKEELLRQNNHVRWVPQSAQNAFANWLKNLRDNSISKQRYWGTPLPIWRNVADPNDYLVIGSARELQELAGLDEEPEDLHIPTVEQITITKEGKTYKRVPDVLDVWVDAGTVSWSCLNYPHEEALFKRLFPAEFILEGKDQIRGWFNLLHLSSNIALGRPCFKNVYMHGFINDSQGRKMSKSLGNYILPDEVVEKYGANTLRYYMIGAANPGLDMNYNFDDVALKHRNLSVFWNIQNLLFDITRVQGVAFKKKELAVLGVEEQYILSKLHTTIRDVTAKMEAYRLNEVPSLIEQLFFDLSRNYIQLVREKLNSGTQEEKEQVLFATFTTYLEGLKLFAVVTPLFAEHVYQNLKEVFNLAEESIHLCDWPRAEERFMNDELEADFVILFDAVKAALAARDSARVGVRWPLATAVLELKAEDAARIQRLEELFKQHVNVKKVEYCPFDAPLSVAPNYKELGKSFGEATGRVAQLLQQLDQDAITTLQKGEPVTLDQYELKPEHVLITRVIPEGWGFGEGTRVRVFLDTTLTPPLEAEGYAREIIRRVQQLRKEAGLQKNERITLWIDAPDLSSQLEDRLDEMKERVGAKTLILGRPEDEYLQQREAKIKGKRVVLALKKE